ncbi:MAG: LytR/AlgR family response regulator transcription factor [Emticicia sp.]|uniref:LytR/AlgR family response regulator transcription factor n=1 Tax=Emticicia sp. TaxID=1930953 RepID=UPI003BA451F6
MIKCVIVDDEPAAVDILTIYAKKVPYLDLKLATIDAMEALAYMQNNDIDLVFLDINMPDISGLSFAQLVNHKTKVVFTTAYSEFALDSYKYDALDYLLKPVPFDHFLRASQKALNYLDTASKNQNIEPKQSEDDYIFVKTEHKGKLTKVMFRDILYIESLKNYVSIYTDNKEQIITLLTMKEMEERLPKTSFFRSHKSFIVSLDKIKAIDGGEIVLQSIKDKVPLGNTFREALFNRLNSKILISKGGES